MKSIFLDYNTTTPIAGAVREAIMPFYDQHFGDPSHAHWTGRVAAEAITDARNAVAALLEIHPDEIAFTSGGCESINLAIFGAAHVIQSHTPHPHMIVSSLEHAVVAACAERLEQQGWEVSQVRCDTDGVIDISHFQELLRPETRLVSLIHANHEIGSIQPIQEISRLCAGADVLVHVDATQSAGKIEVHPEELGVDLLSISGHKMYAPKGVGALYIRSGVQIEPILVGGYQEFGYRAGVENVAHIVGFGVAARLAKQALESGGERMQFLRELFLNQFFSNINFPIVTHGNRSIGLPNTASILLPDRDARNVLANVPEVCFGPCGHDGKSGSYVGISPSLAAIGLTPERARSTFRLSVGWQTTEEEIETAANKLANAYEQAPKLTSKS